MQKKLCASGFLIHIPSQQILLQQNTTSDNFSSPWLLFEKTYQVEEAPEIVFKNLIAQLLHVTLDVVYPVYSYEYENTNQSIMYSELDDLLNFPSENGLVFNWFSFRNVRNLQVTEQTKHDIVVSQRVIEAELRKRRGEHTL